MSKKPGKRVERPRVRDHLGRRDVMDKASRRLWCDWTAVEREQRRGGCRQVAGDRDRAVDCGRRWSDEGKHRVSMTERPREGSADNVSKGGDRGTLSQCGDFFSVAVSFCSSSSKEERNQSWAPRLDSRMKAWRDWLSEASLVRSPRMVRRNW